VVNWMAKVWKLGGVGRALFPLFQCVTRPVCHSSSVSLVLHLGVIVCKIFLLLGQMNYIASFKFWQKMPLAISSCHSLSGIIL
jgi:hypothetical protein